MRAWIAALWARLYAPPRPTRVGLLDSGELVLVAGNGIAQIFSVPTTQTVVRVLATQMKEQAK